MPEFAALPGFRFPFGCLHKNNASLQVKAAFVCSIHLNFLHELITLLDFSSRCLYKESASGGRSVESPLSRNSCHKLRFRSRTQTQHFKKCAAAVGEQPHVFFVPVSLTPPERGRAGWASQGVCLPRPCGPGLAAPELFSETRAQSWCCDPSWRDSSGSERSPLAACGWGHRWPLNLHHSTAALQHSTEQARRYLLVCRCGLFFLRRCSCNRFQGIFKMDASNVMCCQWKCSVSENLPSSVMSMAESLTFTLQSAT